jgi:hypothetical protein
MRLVALSVAIAALGCTRAAHDTGGGSAGSASQPTPAPAPVPAPTPPTAGSSDPAGGGSPAADAEKRAREFLQHQLDIKKPELVKTFTDDAIVLVEGSPSTAKEVSNFGISGGGPDGATIDKATIAKLIAHGTGDAVWFYAEVKTHTSGPGGGPSGDMPTRVVELITASAKWRAVAASFGLGTEISPSGENTEIPNSTGAAGQLADLLASPKDLAAQLAPDAIVVGPMGDQVATGSGAGAALTSWKIGSLTPAKDPREVKAAAWGFAQAAFDRPNATHPKLTDRLWGQAFALPKKDGSWSVVLVQYRSE